MITAEENALAGGFGAAVLEWAEAHPVADGPRVVRLGFADEFQDQASRADLLAAAGLDAEGIAAAAVAACDQLTAAGAARSAS